MKQKEQIKTTDQEQLDESKKSKSTTKTDALLIGFLIGIVLYSIIVNSWGFFTLIPLYLAYRLINKSKKDNIE